MLGVPRFTRPPSFLGGLASVALSACANTEAGGTHAPIEGGSEASTGGSGATGGRSNTEGTGATGGRSNSDGGNDAGASNQGGQGGTEAGSAPICDVVDGAIPALIPRIVMFHLEPPAGVPAPSGLGGPEVVELAGTLTDVAPSTEPCSRFPLWPADCESDPILALRLTLTTTAGPVWLLSVASTAALDGWRASADAIVGETVSLHATYRRGFQFPASRGFVLTDATGIVMASEAGPWVATLDPGALSSLEVTLGADICRYLGSCGGLMISELMFQGDTSVSVGRTEDGEFTLHGHTYGARNSGGGYRLPTSCLDGEHISTWAVWRKAP